LAVQLRGTRPPCAQQLQCVPLLAIVPASSTMIRSARLPGDRRVGDDEGEVVAVRQKLRQRRPDVPIGHRCRARRSIVGIRMGALQRVPSDGDALALAAPRGKRPAVSAHQSSEPRAGTPRELEHVCGLPRPRSMAAFRQLAAEGDVVAEMGFIERTTSWM